MTKDTLNLATTLDAARFYTDAGLKLVPVPRQGNHKDPHKRGWQKHRYELKDFVDEQNIGARLGEEVAKDAFLTDVDIDMKRTDKVTAFPGAAEVVAELLPHCAWVFGRSSAPRAHLLYLTTAPVTTAKYNGLNDSTLIELRGLSPKKNSSQITIVPPGVHHSGERLAFDTLDPVAFWSTKDADALSDGVKYAAVALAILQIWPERGKRHDARLAFSKVLRQVEVPDPIAKAILVAVNRATGSDVADVVPCFADTAGKDPKDTKGASWIIEHLDDGEGTLKVLDRILDRKQSVPPGSFNVTEIDLKTLTPQVWTRLSETNDPPRRLLQGGLPVRVTHIPANGAERRPTWVFQGLDADRLRHETAQVAAFYQEARNGFKQVVPPRDLMTDMLATPPGRVPLPVVTRIIYAPTIAPDGTIQLAPGYQPATGTFYVDGGLVVPPVPDRPMPNDVAHAVQTINEPLQDFAFVAEADRTAAIAFFLLPFVRSVIDGPTPLHLFKKPVAGAGATLLTDTLLYPSVGTDIARLSTVSDDDEWRKQITSTLIDGPSVVLIDNVRELVSPQLAKVITDDVWQARILGVSRNATLRVECVWGATGINPDLHQEITRRIVPCRLDPRMAQPWLREGFRIPNLREWVRAHRADLIWAALTLARSWFAAGCPAGDRSLGMFENWARVVGGILKHAGFADFLGNLQEVYEEADVEGDAIHWFFTEWNKRYQGMPQRITDAAMWALQTGSPMLDLITSEKGRNEQFSKWVRRLKDRVVEVDGRPLRLEPVSTNGKTRSHTWRIACVDGGRLPSTQPAAPLPF